MMPAAAVIVLMFLITLPRDTVVASSVALR
jgi:hypothetical protein